MELSGGLQDWLKEQPENSPPAVSAWMARKFADEIITAFRTMDRRSAEAWAEGVAYYLETLAEQADPGGKL